MLSGQISIDREWLYNMLTRVSDNDSNEPIVRLEALWRLKLLEIDKMNPKLEIDKMNAATPEPKPIANNHPAIADVVSADLISESARMVALDVMARKDFGMKKYGTPLQPFNGRDTLNDLYQELLDAMKYARVAQYECQYGSHTSSEAHFAEDTYETIKGLCIDLKNVMEKRNGAENNKGHAVSF